MKKYFNKFTHSYFWLYSVVCAAAMLLVFNQFLVHRTSFIWLPDSTSQHFTSFVYYGKYLREIAKSLFAGHPVIPQYNFSLGFGEDILSTLHYYVVGDPLNLISAVVLPKYAPYAYTLLMLLRYYLAGLAFMALAKYKKLPAAGSACGALIYIFSAYSLYMAIRHPSFLNPFIYFPLIILGAEMIFDKKRPYLFILSICLSALSSFYFFYVISLFTVLYIFVRLFFVYKNQFFKNFFAALGKFGGSYILGVLMAGIVFVPVVVSFLSASRGSVDYGLNLLYDKFYYIRFAAAFADSTGLGYGTYMGFTALGIAGVVLLFLKRKEHGFLKAGFIILTVMMMFPVVCKITNGFSYVTNRWTFVYGLLVAFIFASQLKDIKKITLKESLLLCGASVLYAVYIIGFDRARYAETLIAAVVLFIFALLCLIYSAYPYIKQSFSREKAKKIFSTAILLLTVCTVYCTGLYNFDPAESPFLDEFCTFGTAVKFADSNGLKTLKKYQNTENAVERYEELRTQLGETNNALMNDTYSNQEYYSLVNSNVNDFQDEMGLVFQNYSVVSPTLADPFIYTAENVKYVVCERVNAGYYGIESEPVDTITSNLKEADNLTKNIYENKNYVPFGFTYNKVISAEDYNALSSTEKRASLLNAVVLNDSDAYVNSQSQDFAIHDKDVDSTVKAGENVQLQNGRIEVGEDGGYITVQANHVTNGQLYCVLHDLYYEPSDGEGTKARIRVKGNGRNTDFTVETPFNDYYSGTSNFTVNMGYCNRNHAEIEITFDEGVYTFDSIQLVVQSLDDFENDIARLRADTLQDLKIEADKISGTISLDESKILYLSVPYSAYWTAVVDGREAEVMKANTAFCAVALDAGEHTVELHYRNTVMDKSVFISLGGWLIFAGVAVIHEAYNKKRKKNAGNA